MSKHDSVFIDYDANDAVKWLLVASDIIYRTRDEYSKSKGRLLDYQDDEEFLADMARRRNREDEWDWETGKAVSEGRLAPEEAISRGFQDRHWLPLPTILWHVSVKGTVVEQTGLKSRREIMTDVGSGLGGGENNTISFTDDYHTALNIYNAMIEASHVVRGEIDLDSLVEQAQDGTGASRPWLNETIKAFSPLDFKLLSQGRILVESRDIHGFVEDDLPLEWEMLPGERTWRDSNGRKRFARASRPRTEEEMDEALWRFYNYWIGFREDAGGPQNPVFFLSNLPEIAKRGEEDVAILEYKSKAGAMGKYLPALNEWRTVGAGGVELVRVLRP